MFTLYKKSLFFVWVLLEKNVNFLCEKRIVHNSLFLTNNR